MLRQELASALLSVSHLKGNFKLRSGTTSDQYFDKYQFESDPNLLRQIAKHMSTLIPPGTEILAGLELGGVPIATALSLETGIPTVFVRKKAKEYGTEKIAEGPSLKGKKVCIVEDVITTGGQVIISCEDLRKLGADVQEVVCVIQRNPEAKKILSESDLHLKSLFQMSELLASQN